MCTFLYFFKCFLRGPHSIFLDFSACQSKYQKKSACRSHIVRKKNYNHKMIQNNKNCSDPGSVGSRQVGRSSRRHFSKLRSATNTRFVPSKMYLSTDSHLRVLIDLWASAILQPPLETVNSAWNRDPANLAICRQVGRFGWFRAFWAIPLSFNLVPEEGSKPSSAAVAGFKPSIKALQKMLFVSIKSVDLRVQTTTQLSSGRPKIGLPDESFP